MTEDKTTLATGDHIDITTMTTEDGTMTEDIITATTSDNKFLFQQQIF